MSYSDYIAGHRVGNLITRVASLLTHNEHRALLENPTFASIVWC